MISDDLDHDLYIVVTRSTSEDRGHYNYKGNDELLACVWIDKRAIYFVSILHPAESPAGVKPPTVKMRGVDRGDQLQ